MHGQGTYTWPDGSRYVGQWFDGYKEGPGTIYRASGKSQSGYWHNDELVQNR